MPFKSNVPLTTLTGPVKPVLAALMTTLPPPAICSDAHAGRQASRQVERAAGDNERRRRIYRRAVGRDQGQRLRECDIAAVGR